MKLADKVSRKPIPFEVQGSTLYRLPKTFTEMEEIAKVFKEFEEDQSNEAPLMILFTDLVVDENGEQYDEIKEGQTFDDLKEVFTTDFLLGIYEAIAISIQATNSGN